MKTGFYKEFYLGSKFIGRKDSEKDRERIGYEGIQTHVAESDIVFKKKKIKKGMEYRTILYPYSQGKK